MLRHSEITIYFLILTVEEHFDHLSSMLTLNIFLMTNISCRILIQELESIFNERKMNLMNIILMRFLMDPKEERFH